MYRKEHAASAKQAWSDGDVVSVGFVKNLEVIKRISTLGDGHPDFYVLCQAATNRFYAFQPHRGGLVRCGSFNETMAAFA